MSPLFIIGLVVVSLVSFVLVQERWKAFRRSKIKARPFPKEWRLILRRNVPYFYSMPADLQLQLKQLVLIFLAEKQFVGYQGLEITDEIRVTIAAQACLLLLNRKTNYYPKLRTIYVYPAAFIAHHATKDAAGVVQNCAKTLSGESWEIGKVVLSWKDSKQGALVFNDGQNVVIHEFAHQLDQETGVANGAPFLKHRNNHKWSETFSHEFKRLQEKARRGEASLLDHYGATNPAEFFAVASEVFFERPITLKQTHSELYQQLKGLYHVDPANW